MVKRKVQIKTRSFGKSKQKQSVFPGIVAPLLEVPSNIARPPYVPNIIALPKPPLALDEKISRMRVRSSSARGDA